MSYNTFHIPNIENCQFRENSSFVPLAPSQYKCLQDLCASISANNHVKFVYRADNRLLEIYNVSDNKSTSLADMVFMVGEKGNAFLKNFNTDCNHVTRVHIEKLFETLHYVVLNTSSNTNATRNRIPEFTFINHNLYRFFANTHNLDRFVRAFTYQSEWLVNDYYEMFLHTISRNGLNNKYSEMLSTSLVQSAIQRFRHTNGIVYVGWVHDNGYIKFGDMNKRNDKIASLGLPTYISTLFPEQKEVCLKYGLPPHNIIGYFYDDQHFVVNHHFMLNNQNTKAEIDDILRHGFYIDQSNFLQYLRKTKYVRGYDVVNNRYIH